MFAMRVLFFLRVHRGGLQKFMEHASNYTRPKQHSPDEHRSIGPCLIIAAIADTLFAMRVLFFLGVHGGGLQKFMEHASNYTRPK
jgi:hypothetical protein